MMAFLNRRTAASSSSWEIGPWRTNWSRISDGTGASGVSGARLFRLRRIGTPHAMPHTRNSGHPRGDRVPRDRAGTFEPQLIGRHERRFVAVTDRLQRTEEARTVRSCRPLTYT